ncbi:hypothetical protein L1887_53992 [Cichorium endivia]|nr:hypothetical protein L1887_53992 [Cichorium endivia]
MPYASPNKVQRVNEDGKMQLLPGPGRGVEREMRRREGGRRTKLLVLADDLVDPAGDVLDVVGGEAGHGDARVGGEVDVALLEHALALVGVEAEEGEHADLLEDVVPVARCLELLGEQLKEALTHGDDAARHLLDVLLPLCKQRWVGEDHLDDARAERRRIRDFGALDGGELREDGGALMSSGMLLRDTKWRTAQSVAVEVARGEALVCTVEEGKVALLDKDVGDLLPLLLRRVDTGGVVRARVQKEDALVLERFSNALVKPSKSSAIVLAS